MSGQFVNVRRSLHRSATKLETVSGFKGVVFSESRRGADTQRNSGARYTAGPRDVESLLAIIDSQNRALSHRAQIIANLQHDVDALGQKLLESRGTVSHYQRLYSQAEKELKLVRERLGEKKGALEFEELSRWNSSCVEQLREREESKAGKEGKSHLKTEKKTTPKGSEETQDIDSELRKTDSSNEKLSHLISENEKLHEKLSNSESKLTEKDKRIIELSDHLSISTQNFEILLKKHQKLEKSYSDLLLSVQLFRKQEKSTVNTAF